MLRISNLLGLSILLSLLSRLCFSSPDISKKDDSIVRSHHALKPSIYSFLVVVISFIIWKIEGRFMPSFCQDIRRIDMWVWRWVESISHFIKVKLNKLKGMNLPFNKDSIKSPGQDIWRWNRHNLLLLRIMDLSTSYSQRYNEQHLNFDHSMMESSECTA